MNAVPAAVLTTLVAPGLLTAGPAEWSALVVAGLVSLRGGLMSMFLAGAAVLILARQFVWIGIKSWRRAAAARLPSPARPASRRRASARSRPARAHGIRRANAVRRAFRRSVRTSRVSIGASVSVSKPCMAMSPPVDRFGRRHQDQVLDADAVRRLPCSSRARWRRSCPRAAFRCRSWRCAADPHAPPDMTRRHGRCRGRSRSRASTAPAAPPRRFRSRACRQESAAWKCRSCLSAPA